MRIGLSLLPLLFVSGCLAGGDGPVGDPCADDAECSTGFCYAATCLDPDGDADEDGVSSVVERAIGTHPLDPDSDDDGIPDGTEIGDQSHPADADGDGVVDALEDLTADADGDCTPDPFDPADRDPARPDQTTLRALFCRGEGVCGENGAARRVFCENGIPRCDYRDVPGFEFEELSCDGRDNDCDGHTDEDLLLEGRTVGEPCAARGACGAGIVECDPVLRAPVCSTRPGGTASQAGPERCNGLDDDCDGATDEGLTTPQGAALGAPCNGVGACGLGVAECDLVAERAVCSTEAGGGASQATPETCDAVDNDCDGETDEALFTAGEGCPAVGLCAEPDVPITRRCQMGRWLCDYEGVPGWEAGVERSCDGADNDCDGETDEDFAFVDFDGLPRRLAAACGTGACAGGVVVCDDAGAAATCSTLAARSDERCDRRDDDCDGLTDEEQLYNGKAPGQLCNGHGECGTGAVECSDAGIATCSTNPDGSDPQESPEVCDGRDNDCDGETDEEQQAPPSLCDAPGVCAGAPADAACVAGEWVCDRLAVEGYESGVERTCDGRDNNCNGLVDEPFPKQFGTRFEVAAPPSPVVRSAAAVALDRSGAAATPRALVWGGRSGGGSATALGDLWARDLATGAWTALVPSAGTGAPPAAAGASLVPAGERLLLVGGGLEDVWSFEPANGVWAALDSDGLRPPLTGSAAAWDGHDDALWIYGVDGDGDGALLRLELDAETPTWSRPTLPDLPAADGARLLVDVDGGRLVALGGRDRSGQVLARTVIVPLDGERRSPTGWWTIDDGPTPPARAEHAAAIDAERGRILMFGGAGSDGAPLGDTWAFDLASQTWTPVETAAHAPPALADAALLLHGDTAWLLGGHDAAGRTNRAVWQLDLETDVWQRTVLPPGPPPLADAATALDGAARRWFVVGGRTPTVDGEALVAGLWAFDLEQERWEQLSETIGLVDSGRADAIALWDGPRRRLLVHGGLVDGADGIPRTSDTLWAWSVDEARWSRPMVQGTPPPPLQGHSVTAVPGESRAFVFGGHTDEGPSAALWQLDLARLEWAPLSPGTQGPPALRGHVALWHAADRVMLVLGGTGGGGQVLRFSPTSSAWSVLVTVPELAGSKPIAWLDALADTLLVGTWRAGAPGPLFVRLSGVTPQTGAIDPPYPSGVRGAVSAHDPATRRAWLFGGRGADGVPTDGLWSLDEHCAE